MWHNYVENTFFLSKLFNDIPLLKGIVIDEFCFDYVKQNVSIKMILPQKVDNVPAKWSVNGFDRVELYVVFCNIYSINVESYLGKKSVDIKIKKLDSDLFSIQLEGQFRGSFISEANYIQTISGIHYKIFD